MEGDDIGISSVNSSVCVASPFMAESPMNRTFHICEHVKRYDYPPTWSLPADNFMICYSTSQTQLCH